MKVGDLIRLLGRDDLGNPTTVYSIVYPETELRHIGIIIEIEDDTCPERLTVLWPDGSVDTVYADEVLQLTVDTIQESEMSKIKKKNSTPEEQKNYFQKLLKAFDDFSTDAFYPNKEKKNGNGTSN